MQKNVNKQLEDLVDKAMRDTSLETPSFGFTHQVMQQVKDIEPSETTTYKPLISKMGWACISVAIIGVFVFLALGKSTESSMVFDALHFNFSIENLFSRFAFKGALMYATILFAVMLCIQLPLLKYYFNSRLEV